MRTEHRIQHILMEFGSPAEMTEKVMEVIERNFIRKSTVRRFLKIQNIEVEKKLKDLLTYKRCYKYKGEK